MKIEITSFNQGETDNLKREDFKTLVLQLPIVLAVRPQDMESEDYHYF